MTGAIRQFSCDNGHDWFVSADAAEFGSQLICPFCHAPGHKGATVEGTNGSSVDETGSQFPGFEIIRELGHGGMGVVYLAIHKKRRQQVALKALPKTLADASLPNALDRFQNEFRLVRGISHPNLVALYEFMSDGQRWFFTMEYVPGENLQTHFDRWNFGRPASDDGSTTTLPPQASAVSHEQCQQVRSIFDQLASAIAAVHAAGALHRDIKPTNVMLMPQGRVVLLDFGLVTGWGEQASKQSTEMHVLGTAKYMSPEQAEGIATPAGDWYGFGSMLFEALAGRLPFEGGNVAIMQKKSRLDPPLLHELRAGIPEDLSRLCDDLLARDPSRRPSGEEIRRRLNAPSRSDSPARLIAPTNATEIAEPALLGRETELAMLNSALATVQQGTPLSVFVVGSSGAGKSALVDTFLNNAERENDTAVLRGRCYEQESVPFKALDGLMDGLRRYLRTLPPATVAAVAPRDAEALLQVFPVLGRVAALAEMPRRIGAARGQAEIRQRACQALRELLIRLADHRLLVVCIDDLQWGDKDSAELLSQLLRPPDPPLMLFLGVYRREDAAASDFLKTLEEQRARGEQHFQRRDLDIRPLDRDEACRLAAGWLGRGTSVGDPLCERIANESGGMPFFIRELAGYYLESAADDDTQQPLDQFSLDRMIWARAASLPLACRELLETVAVAGRPIPVEIVGACLDAIGGSGFGWPMTILRNRQLVRLVEVAGTATIETYHDRIRESVDAHLEGGRRREIHRRLAIALEAVGDVELVGRAAGCQTGQSLVAEYPAKSGTVDWPWVCDLAWHFAEAEDFSRALPYAFWAANRAHAQYSLEIAEQHYQIAERAAESAEVATRCRIAEGLGNVLMLRGKYPAAAERLKTAKSLAVSTNDLARIEGKIGELALKLGDPRSACRAIEHALQLLNSPAPSSTAWMLCQLVREVGVQVIHTYLPKFRGRLTREAGELDITRIRLYGRLAYAYWFSRGSLWALWTHLRGLNLAESSGEKNEIAHAYAEHGPVMSLVPMYWRGVKFTWRSFKIRRELQDTWGQAQSLHYIGITLYAASKFKYCIRNCRRAVATLERLGDFWEQNMARFQIAASLYRLGELAEAAIEAARMHHLGCQIGDVQASGIALDILSKASLGNLEAAVIRREIERRNPFDAQAESQILQAEAIRLLAHGECLAAVQTLTTAREVARKAGVMNVYVSPVLPWLATALRRQAGQLGESTERRKLRRRAMSAAKSGCRIGRRFKNDLPHALRELAMLLAIDGRRAAARKMFERSLAVSARLQMRYEHAQTQFTLAHAGLRFGWPDAERQLAEATVLLQTFDAAIDSGGGSTVAVFGLAFL